MVLRAVAPKQNFLGSLFPFIINRTFKEVIIFGNSLAIPKQFSLLTAEIWKCYLKEKSLTLCTYGIHETGKMDIVRFGAKPWPVKVFNGAMFSIYVDVYVQIP